MPSVSICLPTFNGVEFIAEAIESALNQTFSDFELLISDDASTDSTFEIVQKYESQDSRIKVWRNPSNLGLFANYNSCIEKAQGTFIKLFAQDDLLHPEMIAKQIDILTSTPSVGLVAAARKTIDATGGRIAAVTVADSKVCKPFSLNKQIAAADVISEILRDGINWLGEPSSQMFRAEHKGSGFSTTFKQLGDLEYAFRLLQSGDYFFIAEELCSFRKHDNSATRSNDRDLTSHLEWMTLAPNYSDFLLRSEMTQEEFCMNFIKSWTRDLECELNQSAEANHISQTSMLRNLIEREDILAPFALKKNSHHDYQEEFRILSILGISQSVLLEHELRAVHNEIAKSLTHAEMPNSEMNIVRPGLASALSGLRDTLRAQDNEINELKAQLDQMGQSLSWRITEPIRNLKRVVSRKD